jgi:Flp pilus assembly protein TadG
MADMGNEATTDRTRERGSVMVIAALAMTALLLFAALAIDVGAIWSSRTQSQNADDAAALAAAATMIVQVDTNAATVDLAGARAEGAIYAGANATVGEAVDTDMGGNRSGGVDVVPADFVFGNWNLTTRTLDPPYESTNPSEVTGVRVTVRMDDVANKRSPAFLSRLLGIGGFAVKNIATGYLGFEGSFAPGEFDLPVAIDSCNLSTAGCGTDFCATVASTPNSCPLRWVQGTNPVTCLDFSSTPAQNACWTAYSDSSPSINNPVLQSIVDNGNPDDFQAGDEAYLDNGDKTDTQDYIRNKFYGCNDQGTNCCTATHPTTGLCTARNPTGPAGKPGQEPAGRDRYDPNPASVPPAYAPAIDSWVVKLPVFECQAGVHCSGGGTWKINGGVCFEIREILAPAGDYDDSSRVIKGRFLCPNSPDATERELFDEFCRDDSGPQDPGGCDFGMRADRVVLVE